MSNVPLFVWPVGPIINTEPIRYVVNKTDYDLVVDELREQNRVLRCAIDEYAKAKIDFDDKRLQEDHHAWRERYNKLVEAENALLQHHQGMEG